MKGAGVIAIFEEAVENARRGIAQSLAGSEKVGEAVNLKLTIDLSRRSLEGLPNEVVDIVKREVERYYNQSFSWFTLLPCCVYFRNRIEGFRIDYSLLI